MEKALSYIIVTPCAMSKGRTGGIISRLLSQADLELSGAQIITPSENFARDYAASIRKQENKSLNTDAKLLANYIEKNMSPAKGRCFILLIFSGENPWEKLSDICGDLYPEACGLEKASGKTIRDTHADLILDDSEREKVVYFEPAVISPGSRELASEHMALFARHFSNCKNIIQDFSCQDSSCPNHSGIERTLVIIKPDNWKYASIKPGAIIDMLSRTGLRIIGTKVFRFSINEALEFYGPVEQTLMEKLSPVFGKKAKELLEKEFALNLSAETGKMLGDSFGREYARDEFNKIVEFMSGRSAASCPPEETGKPGNAKCMILVYEGANAVQKIRDVLGPTDPLKAPGGTIRREFGSSIMVNTAHASDSKESYEREKDIIKAEENSLFSIIDEYLAGS